MNNQGNFDPINGQPINSNILNNNIQNQNQANTVSVNNANLSNNTSTIDSTNIVNQSSTPINQNITPDNQNIPNENIAPEINFQQQMQGIPTIEQSAEVFIDNTQADSAVKQETKKSSVNLWFLIILTAIILASIFLLFPIMFNYT